ncbi:MAG: hypothetical protein JWR03_2607 [Cohnella sp.]|nr:hypothetical protein [Cohnella sp.]
MSPQDRMKQLLQRDADQLQEVEQAVASGMSPDAAASIVIGGEYWLSDHVKEALIR